MDDFHLEPRDSQLREDLADAMRDCSAGGGLAGNNSGRIRRVVCMLLRIRVDLMMVEGRVLMIGRQLVEARVVQFYLFEVQSVEGKDARMRW